MDKFDNLIYVLRYNAEAMLDNLKELEKMDADDARVNMILKWVKISANDTENKIEDWGV
ncbi:hypothetical protein [Phascolarctobacterium sp.]